MCPRGEIDRHNGLNEFKVKKKSEYSYQQDDYLKMISNE